MAGVVVLLLAAGGSTRMRGADKLLEKVDGVPLLRRQARALSGLRHQVLVALPPGAADRREALKGLGVRPVDVPDAKDGMSASIRAGIRAAQGAEGLVLLPADMPEITATDVEKAIGVFAAHGCRRIVRATTPEGEPGHPVIFPARCFADLAALSGDQGARKLLQGEDVLPVPLPGKHAVTDLDTPEDWTAWRARRED